MSWLVGETRLAAFGEEGNPVSAEAWQEAGDEIADFSVKPFNKPDSCTLPVEASPKLPSEWEREMARNREDQSLTLKSETNQPGGEQQTE